MASRSTVLVVVFALAAAGPLAGCLDKLLGKGDLELVVRASDLPSIDIRGTTYVNAANEFVLAPMVVSQAKVWPSAGNEGDETQPIIRDVNLPLDFADGNSTEVRILSERYAATGLDKFSIRTTPFEGTHPNGTTSSVAVSVAAPLWEYVFDIPAEVKGGETTTVVMSFMLARRADDTASPSYFVMMLPDESETR